MPSHSYDWTDGEVKQLILTYEKYPVLYESSDKINSPEYNEAIKHIEEAVKRPWKKINRKLTELKHYHRTCLLKYLKTKSPPHWKYFGLMKFLVSDDYDVKSDTESDKPNDSDENNEDKATTDSSAPDCLTFQGFHPEKRSNRIASRAVRTKKDTPKRLAKVAKQSLTSTPHTSNVSSEASTSTSTLPEEDGELKKIRASLKTIDFKIQDIYKKFGSFEARILTSKLYECICQCEKEASERISQ